MQPRIRGLAASAGVRLRVNETEISAAPWALRLGKGLYLLTYLLTYDKYTDVWTTARMFAVC